MTDKVVSSLFLFYHLRLTMWTSRDKVFSKFIGKIGIHKLNRTDSKKKKIRIGLSSKQVGPTGIKKREKRKKKEAAIVSIAAERVVTKGSLFHALHLLLRFRFWEKLKRKKERRKEKEREQLCFSFTVPKIL